MGDKKISADGGITDGVVDKCDEACSNEQDGTANAQDLPGYSESQTTTYQNNDATQQLLTRASGASSGRLDIESLAFPTITHDWATNMTPIKQSQEDASRRLFTAIKKGNHGVINGLLEINAVTTETLDQDGQTPLLAAIDAGHIRTVRLLLETGADPNAYGVIEKGGPKRFYHPPRTYRVPRDICRTPLQLAAAKGNLPVVKLLMETYHADDSLVAPDGELALHLASVNGHREIVAYLPARRGGGFRRWKTRHSAAMRRAKSAAKGVYEFAKFFVYRVPRFFLWSIPKHIVVLPVAKRVRWLYAHRAELPRLLANQLKRFWEGVKGFPGDVWKLLKRVPHFLKEVVKFVFDVVVATVKGIPKALKIAALWFWNGIKEFMGVVGKAFNRLFSFLHTVLVAIATFFRKVTLKNVWDGFVALLHAVVVEGPRRLWHWIRKFGETSIKMLKAMWGCVGEILGYLFWATVGLFTYVPKKLWEILVSILASVGYGGKEIMIWVNPKR